MDLEPAFTGIRALHPLALEGSRDKLHWFLCGWLGGPTTTSSVSATRGCAPATCPMPSASPSATSGWPAWPGDGRSRRSTRRWPGGWPRASSAPPTGCATAAVLSQLLRLPRGGRVHPAAPQRPGTALRPAGLGKGHHLGALRQPALHLALEHRLATGRAMALAVHHAHAALPRRGIRAGIRAAPRAPRRGSGRAGRSRPAAPSGPDAAWSPRRGRRRGGGSSGRRR
jgi:hypothetical protein